MSTKNLLDQMDFKTPEGGNGILVSRRIAPSEWLLGSTGAPLTTTLSTNPGFDKFDTNITGIAWAATKVVKASLTFGCPRDYDETSDILKLLLLAGMSGGTDTATAIDATAYLSDDGTSDLDPTKSADLSATLTWVEIVLSGNSLVRGKSIEIQPFPEAHGTDAVEIYAAEWEYKSMIVANTLSDRS